MKNSIILIDDPNLNLTDYEENWDKKLKIKTRISDYAEDDESNYGYDPTPYIVRRTSQIRAD